MNNKVSLRIVQKNMIKTNSALKISLVAMVLVGLSACGGGKKVVTSDNSASYKGAVSLQPLKRPTPSTTVYDPAVKAAAVTSVEDVSDKTVVEVEREEAAVLEQAYIPEITSPSEVIGSPELTESPELADSPELANSPDLAESPEVASVDAEQKSEEVVEATGGFEIINTDIGETRMSIDAGFDQAWTSVNENLKTSDLTVFSRNKVAGRFAIGCGDIEAATKEVKKSGWSFFNREKPENLEYCALEVFERRDKSFVRVLNRSGVEVSDQYSRPIFERILSN